MDYFKKWIEVDPCVDTTPYIFTVNCNGDWIITYQVYLDLAPIIELPNTGFLSPMDAPITSNANENGTTDLVSGGTCSIVSGAGFSSR